MSFSLKRAVGLTALRTKVSRTIGVPITKQGLERKVGAMVIGALLGTGSKRKK